MADTNIMDERGRERQARFARLYRSSDRFPVFMKAVLTLLVEASTSVPLRTRRSWKLRELEAQVEPAQRKRLRMFLKEHGPGSKARIWSETAYEDEITLTEGFIRWIAPFWAVLRGGELTRDHIASCSGFATDSSVGNIIDQLWDPNRAVMGNLRLEGGRSSVGTRQRIVYVTSRLARSLHRDFPEVVPAVEEPGETIASMFGEAVEEEPQLTLDFKEPSVDELRDTVDELGTSETIPVRAAKILGRHGPLRDHTLADLLGVSRTEMNSILHDYNAYSNARVEDDLFLKNGRRGKETWNVVRLSGNGLARYGLPEHLRQHGPRSSMDLAERLGVSPSLLREAAREAAQNGLILRSGSVWEVA